MAAYLLRRLILGLMSIAAISFISFWIMVLPPGDAVDAYAAAADWNASGGMVVGMAELDAMRKRWGLDKPYMYQYGKWMYNIFQGDFGFSVEDRKPVRSIISERLPLTLALAGGAIFFTWLLAIPIGIYSAVRQYSFGDHFFTTLGFLGLAIPNFLLALVLMVVAIMWFGQNVTGLFSPEYIQAPWDFARVWDLIKHLWLPAIVLGLAGTAALIRIMRANLLDELRKPYVVTARAKGLSELRIVTKYPVRVALNPLVSGIAFLLPQLFSGAVIVAVVLNLPTLGPRLLGALRNQDMMVSGTIVLMLGSLTVLGMLISDLLLIVLDPRIRLTGSR